MRKGFTLVELLAVIVILAVILAIAIPGISGIIDSSRLSSFNTNSKMLEKAAKIYVSVNNITIGANPTEILYSDMKNAGYINTIIDPVSKVECSHSRVYVTNTSGTYTYKGALVCDNYMDIDAYNLITNGDFSDGTTGWSCSTCTLTVTNGVGIYTAVAQYGGAMLTYTTATKENAKGHKVYGRSNVKVSPTGGSVYLVVNDGLGQLTVSHSSVYQYERLSGIWTVNANATGLYIKVQDGRSSNWTQTEVDDFYLLDLTAIYGDGNEPSTTQMNNIMNNMGK